jgi:hypothetical protein
MVLGVGAIAIESDGAFVYDGSNGLYFCQGHDGYYHCGKDFSSHERYSRTFLD